jgi:hypothetical protein
MQVRSLNRRHPKTRASQLLASIAQSETYLWLNIVKPSNLVESIGGLADSVLEPSQSAGLNGLKSRRVMPITHQSRIQVNKVKKELTHTRLRTIPQRLHHTHINRVLVLRPRRIRHQQNHIVPTKGRICQYDVLVDPSLFIVLSERRVSQLPCALQAAAHRRQASH